METLKFIVGGSIVGLMFGSAGMHDSDIKAVIHVLAVMVILMLTAWAGEKRGIAR